MVEPTTFAAFNAELRQLRSQLNLGRAKIAEVCGVSKSLVDCWLLDPSSRNFRPMPAKGLRLLRLELGLEGPAYLHLRTSAEALLAQIKNA